MLRNYFIRRENGGDRKMSGDKCFIVVPGNGFPKYTYEDIHKDDRVQFLNSTTVRCPRSKFLSTLKKLHCSTKINQIVNLPLKRLIWGFSLDKIDWDPNKQYYVLLIGPKPMTAKYMNELKKKHNIKYVIMTAVPLGENTELGYNKYLLDFISAVDIDYLFSSDVGNVEKYGFTFNYCPYSVFNKKTDQIEYDLFFAATPKKRIDNCLKLYEDSLKNGVNARFRLTNVVSVKQKDYGEGVIYNKYIEYPSLIDEVLKSNCILEIVKVGQRCNTLRYYEAVCYNKKLLTTNKNVVNLPFYDPRYMKVFEKPEDIDWEWVKKREPIDYHYDGRFSPTHLIDKIIELEEEKKKEGRGFAEE